MGIIIHSREGREPWTRHRTPGFCSHSSLFTSPGLLDVLELSGCQGTGVVYSREMTATDNLLFSRAFLYLRSILCMAAGMIWKYKLDYSTPLCLNPSVTPSCSEDRICNHHHGLGARYGSASAHVPNYSLSHTPPL